MFASFGNYIFSVENDTLFVHQYVSSKAEYNNLKVFVKTEYPKSEKVEINAKGVKNIALRIPNWCRNFKINCEYEAKNGYVYVKNSNKKVVIEFELVPKLNMANCNVHSCGGKVALSYGPVIYCIESIDNGENLSDILIDKNLNYEITYDNDLKTNVIIADGYRHKVNNNLYYDFTCELEKHRIKFIPYYLFENRGETKMTVWCNVKI